jgi:hypothetical protein
MHCPSYELTWKTCDESRRKCRVSQDSKPLDPAPALICVIDTSVLIELKKLVKMDDQWEVLAIMVRLVEAGSLTFPGRLPPRCRLFVTPMRPGSGWAM